MDTYTCLRPRLRHDGDDYAEGETIELDEDEADRLLALGAIEPAEDSAGPSETLVDLVGTRPANALAEAGLATIADAQAYEGDLRDLKGVGESTAADIDVYEPDA